MKSRNYEAYYWKEKEEEDKVCSSYSLTSILKQIFIQGCKASNRYDGVSLPLLNYDNSTAMSVYFRNNATIEVHVKNVFSEYSWSKTYPINQIALIVKDTEKFNRFIRKERAWLLGGVTWQKEKMYLRRQVGKKQKMEECYE